jgi:glyoxylase-like metal-dependent hydrolase (beta-lactamase superfamily II)
VNFRAVMMQAWLAMLPLGAILVCLATPTRAAPGAQKIGQDLYAYISDNDGSANSTFLVTTEGILVVDTGLNDQEGEKLLAAIRKISAQPVRYIINTHYHPDHQGGNAAVGPGATIVTTEFTRERTESLLSLLSAPQRKPFRLASLIIAPELTIFLGGYRVEVHFPGKGHTSGDAIVYFPQQQAVALGDLFMHGSCPAMDEGSVENWIRTLDQALSRAIRTAVPGHFALGAKEDVKFFRDYLADLFAQVKELAARGASLNQVRRGIHMDKYQSLRQFPQYEATFADNAASIYRQLKNTKQ